MEDLQLRKYLYAVMQRQDIILEQLSAISKVLANQFNLPIEEGECEDEVIGTDK